MLQVATKRSERTAAWLVWLPLTTLAFGLAVLCLAALIKSASRSGFTENPSNFFIGILVIAGLSFAVRFLLSKLHDALATYTLDEHGAAKQSPFWRQTIRWAQVAGWAIADEFTWWLLNTHGRSLLSLDWHLLPPERVSDAQAFVYAQLRRFLPSAKDLQPNWWKRRPPYSITVALYFLLIGLSLWRLTHQGAGLIAILAWLTVLVGALVAHTHILSAPRRAQFLVYGDWLILLLPFDSTAIHLPTVKSAVVCSGWLHLVGSDGTQCLMSPRFSWLIAYIKSGCPIA